MDRERLLVDYQYISGANEYEIGPHEDRDRILPACVAVHVLEGAYYVDFENETVCIRPGETIFIQSFLRHHVRMQDYGRLTHAHFLCSYAAVDLFNLANMDYFIAKGREIRSILYDLNRQPFHNAIANQIWVDETLSKLFLLFFRNGLISPEVLNVEPWLNKMLQFISANIEKGITIEEVISVSGYSKTTFYKIFQSRMKVSPHKFMESERLKTAAILLLTGKKAKDVAKTVGFQDAAYFTKVFKKIYGTTPTDYKRKIDYEGHS